MTLEPKNNYGALRTNYVAKWMPMKFAATFSNSFFYKYFSEKQHQYTKKLLQTEAVQAYCNVTDEEDIESFHEESLLKLGCFLRPEEWFSVITLKGNASLEEESNFILNDLNSILGHVYLFANTGGDLLQMR